MAQDSYLHPNSFRLLYDIYTFSIKMTTYIHLLIFVKIRLLFIVK